MQLAIIGHGPSLLKAHYGREIDGHDLIVRLKRSAHLPRQYPQFFGTRTNIVCGSLTIAPVLAMDWPGQRTYWIFADTRTFGPDAERRAMNAIPGANVTFDEALCERWVSEYRRMRLGIALADGQKRHEKLSDDHGHLHCSAGMFAVIYAMAITRPTQISLYGFDNIRTGGFTWSLTRGPEWNQYPDHNWETESRLLREVCNAYGYEAEIQGDIIRCSSAM